MARKFEMITGVVTKCEMIKESNPRPSYYYQGEQYLVKFYVEMVTEEGKTIFFNTPGVSFNISCRGGFAVAFCMLSDANKFITTEDAKFVDGNGQPAPGCGGDYPISTIAVGDTIRIKGEYKLYNRIGKQYWYVKLEEIVSKAPVVVQEPEPVVESTPAPGATISRQQAIDAIVMLRKLGIRAGQRKESIMAYGFTSDEYWELDDEAYEIYRPEMEKKDAANAVAAQ